MAIECLNEVLRQIDETAQIVLIDSASKPQEAGILREFAGGRADFGYIRLDQPGVSLARNAGIAATDSEWVVFVDDDALPFAGWYSALHRSVKNAPPCRAGIGGRVVASFPEGMNPPALDRTWRAFLSVVDRPEAGSVENGCTVVAANYAVRRAALAETGNFNEKMGRMGDSLISGGDSHVTKHLIEAGYEVWYDPSFAVYHRIPTERLTRRWILRRVFMEGVSDVRMHRHDRVIPTHLGFGKLLASLPFLAACCLTSPREPRNVYRLVRALGGLRAHIFERVAR